MVRLQAFRLLLAGEKECRQQPEAEGKLSLNQWLQPILDNPGGLLKRKFRHESEQRSNWLQAGRDQEQQESSQARRKQDEGSQEEEANSTEQQASRPSENTDEQARSQSLEDQLEVEGKLSLNQWLQPIPDNPGDLLKRKFRHESEQRMNSQQAERNQNKTRIRTFCLLLFALLVSHSVVATAGIRTSVNSNQIDTNETLVLTVQIDNPKHSEEPDFRPLERDWRILSTSKRTELRMGQGQFQSITRWDISLSPKRAGDLVIPALVWGSDSSVPVRVRVTPLNQSLQQRIDRMAYFRTSVSSGRVWVQSQVIYSVVLYYTQQVQPSQDLSPPDLPNARVQALDKGRINVEIINGVRYRVYRRNYAIFPQGSGELILPPESVTGYIQLNQYNRRTFNISSSGHTIRVLSQPDQYPRDSVWLPARDMSISARLDKPSGQIMPGTAISLFLELKGEKVAGSLLPSFPEMKVDGLNIYKQPNRLEEFLSSQGVNSRLANDIAIIPTQPGRFQLPEIRFAWWDTQRGVLKEVLWPGLTLEVAGQAATLDNPEVVTQPNTQVPTSETKAYSTGGWALWLSLFLGIGWLLTLVYLGKLKSSLRSVDAEEPEPASMNAERYFQRLMRACRQKDRVQIRQLLESWLRAAHPESGCSLSDLLKNDPEGQRLLAELNRGLYQPGGKDAFDADSLVIWLKKKRSNNRIQKTAKKRNELTSLYPKMDEQPTLVSQ